jgi:hypothetical protein
MTEADWGSEGAGPKPKRIPTWLWFCGGGCLIAIVLAVVAAVFAFQELKSLGDAEKQLPVLSEKVAHDPLPPEMHFEMRMPVLDWFVFSDERGYGWIIYAPGPAQAAEMRRMLLDPGFTGSFFGQGGRKEPREAVVRVQGRDVRGVRCIQLGGGSQPGADHAGPSIVLDVTPEGQSGLVAVQLVRVSGEDEIGDDDVRELLRPFHVGPER